MFQSTEWKPGDATRLIEFHKRYTPEPPELADLLDYEAATAAWLQAHVPKDAGAQDARCKACGVEYLRGELSADGLCRHCADEADG